MDQLKHRHSWPKKDTKRQLSPHQVKKDAKKVKSVYIIESPGGTFRETSPTKIYQPDMQQLRITSLPVRPAIKAEPDSSPTRGVQSRQLLVRETLLKGIAMGFERAQAFEAQPGASSHQWPQPDTDQLYDTTTVDGMQRAVDRTMHVAEKLHPDQIQVAATKLYGHSEAVHPILTDKRPGVGEPPSKEKPLIAEHFWKRKVYALAAAERFGAMIGVVNYNPFVPPLVDAITPMHQDLCMHVQERREIQGSAEQAKMGLLDCLLSSSHENGYKKLEIESLVFKKTTNRAFTVAGLVSPMGSRNSDTGSEEILMEINAFEGRINLYETNIIDRQGTVRTWIWFKITKPLFSVRGRAPRELKPMPDSCVVFAAPTLQDVYEDFLASPPRLADFNRLQLEPYARAAPLQLNLTFQYCKDGIPSFQCSSKPECVLDHGIPEDFLWVDMVPTYTGQHVNPDQWWEYLKQGAINDKHRWMHVQSAMAKFSCLVEVRAKTGIDWVESIPPERPPALGETSQGNMWESGSGSGTGSERRRSDRGMRRSSGLRNEVLQD